ncbi:MAG TPA: glucoamylase family protein [bacterium]|nr:glucoamylase family protein [bacterium]
MSETGRWDAPFEEPPEEAIREEIFSVERLESHAQALALEHLHGASIRRGRLLAPRVRENVRELARCHRKLDLAVALGRPVPPAAKWLLENFHLVSGLGKAIDEELPAGYYRELPKLGRDEMKGYPRIYGLAWSWVAHCDSHFDSETLCRFVAAYQRIQPLTIGELWALSITLRIVLHENLKRQAQNVVVNLRETGRADRLADLLLGLGSGQTLDPARVPGRFRGRTLPPAFSVRLFQRLGEQVGSVGTVLAWLSEALSLQGTSFEALARKEHQEQLARNASCRNGITSLRDIAQFDWPTLVERLSLVDEVFRGAFDFQGLNFATRDSYRHAVENLARGCRYSQVEIARFACQDLKAAALSGRPEDGVRADAGYCLIGPGSRAFERQVKYAPPLGLLVRRAATALASPLYLGALAVLTLWSLSLPLGRSLFTGLPGPIALCMACLALLPASEIAVALVNHAVMQLWPPRSLPALGLKGGVPESLRTMVVMPVILQDEGGFRDLVETLEVHYLANPEREIFFGLLTDWPDAPTAEKDGEAPLLQAALAAVRELNLRHGPGPSGLARFGLYHRARRYNASADLWMGWERKRGKLLEFNQLLRGRPGTSYICQRTDAAGPLPPPGVRFVITLDQDTRLPRGSALRLVGTLAHPLNLPRLNAAGDRVVRGYGILQPRISPTLPSKEEATLFNRLSSGRAGADPYAFAVSEVYQDLFEEGSYTGKGIYDVDAFDACLAGRIPENSLLSHDLLEGSLARAGLVSDIEVYEEFSGHYQAAAGCRHRWARGDWQLLPWIFGFAQGAGVRLGVVARWKMCDNLRRSLVAPATFLALVASLFLPLRHALAWSSFVLASMALPPLLSVLVTEMFPQRRNFSVLRHWRFLAQELGTGLLKLFFSAALLPADAWLMVDAVARTLFRLFISRRRLLEWTSSAKLRKGMAETWPEFFALLSAGPAAGAALLMAACLIRPPAWPLAGAFSMLWLASPALGRFFSLRRPPRDLARLGEDASDTLHRVARRTWHYFETLVDASVHHLPPDNFQESPSPVLADRSSPTNLGLYLLSCAAARDFGWLGTPGMLDRFEAALDSMESMEKHQGHFFNWYDLRTLKPLEPRFVSTVDSGNLAGHLLVARQALLETLGLPLLAPSPFEGMRESLALATAAADSAEFIRLNTLHDHDLRSALAALCEGISGSFEDAPAFRDGLARLAGPVETLADIAKSLSQEHSHADVAEFQRWTGALRAELEGRADYARKLLVAAPGGFNPGLADAAAAYRGLGLEGPARACDALVGRLKRAAERLQGLFDGMRFGFLYDPSKKLFSIGFRPSDGMLDSGYYDLLASEARLASYVAVARGEVDTEHWFKLGRPLTPVSGDLALLSWSGSMFEYLMPLLVMQSPPESLLFETYRAVVKRQIRFGLRRGLPWGVSESACNIRDKDMTYQYSDFGVEGLGLKGGLARHKVVAPYATALALMVDPLPAAANLERLAALGAMGVFGYYDAVDFGDERLPEGEDWAVVKTYMAHHQGMTLVSLVNALKGGLMQSRFQAVPMLKSAALLLQERTPRDVALIVPGLGAERLGPAPETEAPALQRVFDSPHMNLPRAHLLGNGSYSVLLTASGGGYSRWNKACVTRFRDDASRDSWGGFIFIRDMKHEETWSAAYLPSRKEPDSYRVLFKEDKAEFIRRDGALESRLEVAVSPEDDVEVRRLTLKNFGFRSLDLELTSYAELSLSDDGSDLAHPAFAKLFVQTEYVAGLGALLAHRRPRGSKAEEVWAAHLSFSEEGDQGGVHFETDRARFLGRGRDIFNPAMGLPGRLFSNSAGAVLDPVFSLRRRVLIEPGGVAHLSFATMAAPSREKVLELATKIKDGANVERLFGQAWIHAQVQLRHRGIQPEEARLFQILAGHLRYPDPRLRSAPDLPVKNRLGSAVLWSHGISGDLPLLLLRMDGSSDREILRQLVLAWEYWRLKNLAVDLVVLNEEPASYAADLQRSLEETARGVQDPAEGGRGGGIYVVKACLLPEAERDLFLCAARVVLRAGHGSLSEQLARVPPQRSRPPELGPAEDADGGPPEAEGALEFMNGLGGFADGGREYRVVLEEGQDSPAPWINVIANAGFGFQVSESGSGYTWAGNSRENKLSPWSNDPVSDRPGEAIYVRDMDNGALFTPSALPVRLKGGRYSVSHGQGYSRFESAAQGIQMCLTQFVPLGDPIKLSRLVLKNVSGRTRRLSLTAYVEWVLGVTPQSTGHSVVTEAPPDLALLTARNPFNAAFPGAIAFLDVGGKHSSFTCERGEFIGRHGSLRRPQALGRDRELSGKTGAGSDPCGALQSQVTLRPGESAEFRVLLGQGRDREEVAALSAAYRNADLDALLEGVKAFWGRSAGALQVRTPDRAMDLMLNRWLPYQTLSCRIWARSALYQCGGAYGFRDQLQDVLAVVRSNPDIARAHILLAAGKQFAEGDVLHWWHPPLGAGVRTRISDDRLWLPYAVARYAEESGDAAVLDERVPFLEGPALEPGKADLYFQPAVSGTDGSLYEHCARALDCSLKTGSHGLPLMGSGDWNDGMNKVGEGGKGESVWLAWFLVENLRRFAGVAEGRGDGARAALWRAKALEIAAAAEAQGWDGDWYRRAFFDDGSPLGSAGLAECRIDSIAQSWAVLSRAADPARAARAMAALEEYLWKKSDGLQLLLSPPFAKADPDPGYIMGYLPGIRENGGQYNHAAAWSVAAFAGLGDGAKAHELFTMLNPVRAAGTRAGMQRYKVEPYVMAGDVYSQAPHVGRGGWSWYTGSAAWMLRVGVESILGLSLHGDAIGIDPCIPPQWPGFELFLDWKGTPWQIQVSNPDSVSRGVKSLELDGIPIPAGSAGRIRLRVDGKAHLLRVILGV